MIAALKDHVRRPTISLFILLAILATSCAPAATAAPTATAVPVATVAPTAAPTEVAAAGCGYAFVHNNTIGNSQFETDMSNGVKRARAELGLTIDEVESTDAGAIADNIRAFAQKGCYKLIVISSFLGGEALTQVAKEFPQQQFAIFDTTVDLPNVMSYTQASEQATYVLGVVAARMTKTGKIGALFGIEIPPLLRWKAGYEEGAHSVDPKVEVLTDYVGSFTDPAKSLTLAIGQKARGADIILSATGSNRSVYAEADKEGYQVVGAYQPEVSDTDNGGILVLLGGNYETAAFVIFEDDVKGKHQGGTVRDVGLAEGIYTFPPITEKMDPYTERVPADVAAQALDVYNQIVSGKLVIKNPLKP